MRRLALAAIAALVALAPVAAAAKELPAMSADEIRLLQQRLTDAGCYKGPLDGLPSGATAEAVKACPDQEPKLRIEVGMHTAPVKRISADATCRVAATAADDKTVRLWSMPEGRLLRTTRLPIGDGDGGKAYAVALSPDGGFLAVGGSDATYQKSGRMAVQLHDLRSGSIRRIGALENIVNHLAFSPEGSRIAAALGGGQGIRVFDRDSGRELLADREFADGAQAYGVAFGRDGALYATGYDGFVRRWDAALKRTAKVAPPHGKRPYAIAVDPDGRRLAVGYADTAAVSILDAVTLQPIAAADTAGVDIGTLSGVAWSADGPRLLAGGEAAKRLDGTWRNFIRSFDRDGRRLGDDRAVADNTILDLQPCGGRIAFAVADPAFGLIDPAGVVTTVAAPRTADMRGKRGSDFTIAPDGQRLRFGLGLEASRPVLLDLAGASLLDAGAPVADLQAAKTDGLPVTDWKNGTAPMLAGRPLMLDRYETSRALAVRPDVTGFVVGTGWSLRAFDAAGTPRWQKPVPGTAWGVNLVRGGELVVAAHGDGTIRWYRWSDGAELLAFFVDVPTRRWVAWTPTGYYMASAGGEDLIGWHLNRGWEQEPDFFPASRFRDRFARPDVVAAVLDTLDEGKAIDKADAARGRKPAEETSVAARLPPVIRILSPAEGARVGEPKVTIDYELRSPSGLAVDRIEVLIDGRPPGTRALTRVDPNADPTAAGRGRIEVELPMKDAEVALIARSGELASEPARVRLAYAGKPPVDPAEVLKPKLYVFAIGVAAYADPTLKLGFAAKDARDFARAVAAQKGGLYRDVELRVITDREATRDAVVQGFGWLRRSMTSRDIGMVFMAGHGIVDEQGDYWFLPVDAAPATVETRGVAQAEIRRGLRSLPGKAVLFFDTCHSGKAAPGEATRGDLDINAVVSDLGAVENGVVTFASSTGRQVSIEREDWGNGAFTKALVAGLSGEAALLGNGTITLSELDAFVADRVKALTGGRQHPVMVRPNTVSNFTIALRRP